MNRSRYLTTAMGAIANKAVSCPKSGKGLRQSITARKSQQLLCYMGILLLFPSCTVGQDKVMKMATQRITFTEPATGGFLCLYDAANWNSVIASVKTTPGESAESVASRLSEVVKENPSLSERYGNAIAYESNSITGLAGFQNDGWYAVGGTENGLGIPLPPSSLSAHLDDTGENLDISWSNPPGGYDSITVAVDGPRTHRLPGSATFCRTASFEKALSPSATRNLICVIGYRGNCPSNAARVAIMNCTQREMMNSPFAGGIMPNWRPWSKEGSDKKVEVMETRYPTPKPTEDFPSVAQGSPPRNVYQLFTTQHPDSVGGIYRQFLGLKEGHTYRVSARINTLGFDSAQGGTFSFHAALDGPDGAPLSASQLTGDAPLPDGTAGPDAGQIAKYGRGKLTEGEWVYRSTDEPSEDTKTDNLTVPPNVHSLTVWFRAKGLLGSGVGASLVSLEDLDCSQ